MLVSCFTRDISDLISTSFALIVVSEKMNQGKGVRVCCLGGCQVSIYAEIVIAIEASWLAGPGRGEKE